MQSIKWISLMLIFILSALLGNIISKKYKDRVKELKEIKTILNTIETKIKFTQQPLTVIFQELGEETNNKTNMIFKEIYQSIQYESLEKAWNKAILNNREKLNLIDEDIKIIKGMGKNLGKTDVEGQIKEIETAKEFIITQIEKAEEEKIKNEKMYKTLGGIVGIGIVIILI